MGLSACVTQVQASDIQDLVKHPQDYLGQEIEMKAYCIKGGRSGDVLGYECTTKDGVYVNTGDITPEEAKAKLADDCAGGKCETTISFEPHSFTTSGVIEPDRDVVVFNTKTAKVSF
ncbi:hypothetical protein AUC68_11355 [Methyloceanibacter methanicus]|uniref:Uncharacterized protein n=1 Tax=Methyloceanibacter methanicus TaxID=1774968 RepID=A0A1E3VX22_9HYPH|nr:hypothetical protein [Methyloceanibacter methanicus]ODR98083.1 hypothetical protein AUC68_11355 [Methyloceanibacter methanicus]